MPDLTREPAREQDRTVTADARAGVAELHDRLAQAGRDAAAERHPAEAARLEQALDSLWEAGRSSSARDAVGHRADDEAARSFEHAQRAILDDQQRFERQIAEALSQGLAEVQEAAGHKLGEDVAAETTRFAEQILANTADLNDATHARLAAQRDGMLQALTGPEQAAGRDRRLREIADGQEADRLQLSASREELLARVDWELGRRTMDVDKLVDEDHVETPDARMSQAIRDPRLRPDLEGPAVRLADGRTIDPGRIPADQVAGIRAIIGKRLDQLDDRLEGVGPEHPGGEAAQVQALWRQAASETGERYRHALVADAATRDARSAFDQARERFWTLAHDDPAARAFFEERGFQFDRRGNAPVHNSWSLFEQDFPKYRDEFRLSLEHQQRLSDAPQRALDPANLQFATQAENRWLEHVKAILEQGDRRTGLQQRSEDRDRRKV